MLLEQQLHKAHKLYNEGNYKEALVIYDEAFCKVALPSTDLVKEYASCLQERLRYAESIELTNKVLQENPNDSSMLLNLCICLGKQNKHRDALRQYEKILLTEKDYTDQIGYYAYLLERTGNIEKADIYYKKALEFEPENLWYISHYAFFLQKIKRYEQSEFYYKKAIESDPENTWLIKRYAFFINEMRGKIDVYSYYDNLIMKEPSNYNYHINMAEATIIFKDGEKARKHLEKADKLDKPLVMELILLFYWGVYFIYIEDYKNLGSAKKKISIQRENYKSYIHRDLIDLGSFIDSNFSDIQKEQYNDLLISLNKEGKRDANN